MWDFLTALLQCSVSMSLVTLVYAAILPLLSKRYAAKWRYMVWLVIAAGWIFPFRPRIDLSFLPMQMTDIPVMPVQPIINAIPPMTTAGNVANAPATISLWWVLGAIWILGVASVVLYHALQHGRFMKMVRRWSEPVTDLESLGILDSLKSELGIKAQIKLSVCQSITSPMLVGFFLPAILLPPAKIAGDELSLILKHELIHFQRHDLWYKALILAATALHWFNPVVCLMTKEAAVQCEISCDALVLQGADFERRKQYGETIIGVVRNGAKLQTALSTNFYGGKRGMKNRISSIMDTKRKRAGVVVLCMALAGIIMTGATLAAAADTKELQNNYSLAELDRKLNEEAEISNSSTSMMSYVNEIDGKTYYSWDEGKTWTPLTDEEYEAMFPTSDVVWWTYDEYKAWLENEKVQLQDMIGEKGWNPTDGWYVWTQAHVDEMVKLYEENLQDLKDGKMLSKSVDDDENLVICYDPKDSATTQTYSIGIRLDNGEEAHFGPYSTKEEMLVVVKPYCEKQVKAGNMSQQEADEIISKY